MNPELPSSQGPEPLGAPPPQLPPSNVPPDGSPRPKSAFALERLVREFRARQKGALWTEAVLYGVVALIAFTVLGGFLAQWHPMLGRVAFALGPVGFVASLIALGAFRAGAQVGDETRSAKTIGERTAALGDDALSALELRRDLGGSPRFSQDLAQAFLDDVDARAAKIRVGELIPNQPVKRALLAVLGMLLVASVALIGWTKDWTQGTSKALMLGEQAQVAVHYEPITGDIELTYKYPAYTGMPPRTVTGTSGEISAPAGTEVAMKTRSDRPVKRAEVVVNGNALPMQVTGERDLAGRFVVSQPGSYHFRFLGALGRETDRGPDIPVNVEADGAPKVEIQLPGQDVEIDRGQSLTLRYEASDDYGLTKLELVYRLPSGKEQRIALHRDDGRRTRGTYAWDLGNEKLMPGDRVTYYIEARDNDAVAGQKRGVSRTQVVRIYSAAEHAREARQKAEELWERLVSQLGDRLDTGETDALQDATVKTNARIDEAGVQLAQDLGMAAAQMGELRDPPIEIANALITISDSYGKTARRTRDLRRIFLRYSNHSDLAGDFGRRLTSAVREEISELEKDVLYLESLIDRRKLEELRELAKELDGERRELSDLLDQYEKSQDPNLREQILQEVQDLRRRIDELSQRMAELAKSIRDEHLNSEALQEMMQQQDMRSKLDEVEKLLREGKTDEAKKQLQQMAMQLDEMMKKLDDADENFGEEQFPELAQKFGDFMKQLDQTQQDQKALSQQTKEIRDRYREKMKERLKNKAQQLKDELTKKVEQAQKDYGQVNPDRLNYGAERPLQQIQSELENLQNALKVEDFDLAAESAARAERAADELKQLGEMQAANDELWGNPPDVQEGSKKFAEQLGKDAKTVREVNQALQQLFPPAGSMMSQEDQQKMKQLAEQQQKLQQQAQGLQQQMEEMGQMAPIFDEEAMQKMEQIGERMGEAEQRMQSRDPSRGYGEQQAALEQLQQFQQQMQQSKGGQGQGGLPLPMIAGRRRGMGNGNSQEDVKIPDAEQYQAPKEFRKDLLDAMKQGAPEKYKDQVKRYYEELVK